MKDERIRRVIDTGLFSLRMTERDVALLMERARGGARVKRKLSAAFVLILALVVLSLTAFALISLRQAYERVIEREGAQGLIRDWSAKDKIELVALMRQAGAQVDAAALAQLEQPGLSEEERGRIAWRLIEGCYPARDGVLTSVDVMARELGPIERWSLEDKAWFTEMLLKHQPREVSSLNLLPPEDGLSEAQVIAIMYDYYEREHGLKKDQFDAATLSLSYAASRHDGQGMVTEWGISVSLLGDEEHPLGMAISPDGRIRFAVVPHTGRAIYFD